MEEIRILEKSGFPDLLKEITDPPKKLYVRGTLPTDPHLKYLSVVGSRKYTNYGKDACLKLISGLRGYPIVVVSGLALGLDGVAHRVALDTNLQTIGVPGSGLNWEVIHPRTNYTLAKEIVDRGGALLSEYEPNFKPTIWSFPKRNRIMAGLSHAVLIVEAGEKSGTLITARLAMEYNRDVLVVPHPIFSFSGSGSNALLRQGAIVVTKSEDILESLRINPTHTIDNERLLKDLSGEEKRVVKLLREPLERDELIRALGIPTHEASVLLSAMEIKGIITEQIGLIRLC